MSIHEPTSRSMTTQNVYQAFYDGRPSIEVRAASMLKAKELAIAHYKPPKSKRHMVSVVLTELAGQTVIHSTAAF